MRVTRASAGLSRACVLIHTCVGRCARAPRARVCVCVCESVYTASQMDAYSHVPTPPAPRMTTCGDELLWTSVILFVPHRVRAQYHSKTHKLNNIFDPLTASVQGGGQAEQVNTRKHVSAAHGTRVPCESQRGGHREKGGEEEEEIDDLLYELLTRKEVSVGWKDTSIPHLLGYGSLLYVVEQLLMYPSDLLKTRLQADLRPDVNLSKVRGAMRRVCMRACECSSAARNCSCETVQKIDRASPCSCVRVHLCVHKRGSARDGKTHCQDWLALCKHIHRHEGWRGFFRGFALNAYGGIPDRLAFLITYNWCKDKVENVSGDSPLAPLFAGSMAAGLTAGFCVPLDVVVQRMQIQGGLPDAWNGAGGIGAVPHSTWPSVPPSAQKHNSVVFKGALGVIKDVVREDGVLGFWRGMGAHLACVVPQAAIWWASFEGSKGFLARRAPNWCQGMPVHFMAGISAGVVSSILTNPLDTIKVRVQLKVGASASALSCLGDMVRHEGFSAAFGESHVTPRRHASGRTRRRIWLCLLVSLGVSWCLSACRLLVSRCV